MNIRFLSSQEMKPEQLATEALALAWPLEKSGDHKKSPHFGWLDELLHHELAHVLERERFTGKAGQCLKIHTLQPRLPVILLVGIGDAHNQTLVNDRDFAAIAYKAAKALGARKLALIPWAQSKPAAAERVEMLAYGAALADYTFDRYFTGEATTQRKREAVSEIVIHLPELPAGAQNLAKRAVQLATHVKFARDLVNEPASVIDPEGFANIAADWGKKHGLKARILLPKELKEQRMNLLLAVAQGSAKAPRVLHLTYTPRKKSSSGRKVVLIGKGVTFDAGGLCIKPTAGMLDMKVDMSGAAAVIATMAALSAYDVEHEVHGLIGLVENMPSGTAYRPGDIIQSRAGLTIEINNTDAEGRLVLADLLDYARDTLKPTLMIDLATLTGACLVALGPYAAGLFASHTPLATELLRAAEEMGEEMWQLPLAQNLKEQLKSDAADMKNTGDRSGGSITAALFLQAFAKETPWAHLDIAGPATSSVDKSILSKGGTGFGAATLLRFLAKGEAVELTLPVAREERVVKSVKAAAKTKAQVTTQSVKKKKEGKASKTSSDKRK